MEIIFERFVARLALEIVFSVPSRFMSTIKLSLEIVTLALLILNLIGIHTQLVSIHPLVTCHLNLFTLSVHFLNLTYFPVYHTSQDLNGPALSHLESLFDSFEQMSIKNPLHLSAWVKSLYD